MSSFMAAMRMELREKGRIDGFGGMSSAAWADEVRDYERKLEDDRARDFLGNSEPRTADREAGAPPPDVSDEVPGRNP